MWKKQKPEYTNNVVRVEPCWDCLKMKRKNELVPVKNGAIYHRYQDMPELADKWVCNSCRRVYKEHF